MVELKKKYRIVYKDTELVFPLTEKGMMGVTYPANDAEYAEFDTYDEAKAFVESNGLSYKGPTA